MTGRHSIRQIPAWRPRSEPSTDLHAVLLEGISNARRRRYLSPTDDEKLDGEIRNVGANKSRLVSALTVHHAWQRAHDRLELLNEFRDTERFGTDLRRFCQNDLLPLLDLVDQELALFAIEATAAAESAAGGVEPIDSVASAPTFPKGNARKSDFQSLKEHLEALRPLGDMTRDQARGKGGADFDGMRVLFDDAFYRIDERTLSDVLRCRERVSNVERLLGVLATGLHQAS